MSTDAFSDDERSERRRSLDIDGHLDALRSSDGFGAPDGATEAYDSNDHIALLYQSAEEQFEAVVPFVRRGLERGERCVYIVGENSEEAVVGAMQSRGIDVEGAVERGALTFLTGEETYLRDDSFDADEMLAYLEDATERATSEYEGLRITGEMAWGAEESLSVDDLTEYERRADELFVDANCVALCQYDRGAHSADVIRDVVRTHPYLVFDGTVCRNPYYAPPEEFLGPDRPELEVDRMLETARERTEANTTLERRESFLRRQNDITASPETSFEEKLQSLFELGCERFGLELGAMARIDPEANSFEVEHVSGDHDRFEPGLELPLSETYCPAAVDESGAASVADALDEGYEDIVVNREYGFEAYLGTYIEVTGDSDRTFFFVSSEPRAEPFPEEMHTFLDLMSRWVTHELERRQWERDQRTLYDVTSDTDLSLDRRLDRLLELGAERLGVDVGMLARERGAAFEVERIHGSRPDLDEGMLVSTEAEDGGLRADAAGETLTLTDPDGTGRDGESASALELTCYARVRVDLGNGGYGMLCFTAREPRERPFSDAERGFLELISQSVSYELERKQREDHLGALNALSRDLMGVETAAEVSGRVVATAGERLGLPITAIALYDEEEGVLRPDAQTRAGADLIADASLLDVGEGAAWDALVESTPQRTTAVDADVDGHPPITEVAIFPFERYGVLITATTANGGFGCPEFDFVETVAANAEAAFDRAHREQQVQERESALEEQNETLERLSRVNDIIRAIDKSLVRASTRTEIESVVCDRLAESGPYELAWVGDWNARTEEIRPRQWAGVEEEYLKQQMDQGCEGDSWCPIAHAVESHEPVVVNDILNDDSIGAWREEALNRGYHSMVTLPLVYEGSLYGVLAVYANRPGVFGELERSVLTEMSDTIANGINSVESKKALVSDGVTELEFAVDDPNLEMVSLVRAVGCELELESLVPRADGRLRAFYSTRGAPADELVEYEPDLPVTDLSLLTEYEEDGETVCLFEAELSQESLGETVLDHGGRLRRVEVDGETLSVTVDLAADAAVREFVEMFRSRYPASEVVAQRSRERPRQTPTEFRAGLTEDLTPRQVEALQTAYFSGYFETPRTRTGREVAETMGITQPTFNAHFRTAQRKLCRQLFEREPPET